ncbi:unnamed protein product, partial [Medioppia subpectinata]
MIDTIIRSLNKIFIRYIHTKELLITEEDTDANRTYKKWLIGVYERTNGALLRLLGDNQYSKSTQKLALNSLMKCVAEEGKYPFRTDVPTEAPDTFADQLLNDICRQLLSNKVDNRQLIANFKDNYLDFDDCIHYTLKAIQLILKEVSDEEEDDLVDTNGEQSVDRAVEDEVFIRNTYELLSAIRLKTPTDLLPRRKKLREKVSKTRKSRRIVETDAKNIILCVPTQPLQKCFRIDYERDADIFANNWTLFLRQRLPKDLYKKVLILLDKELIQHFKNPLLLTDFLVNSYSIGGVVSLLSLSSLYVLITKCNLNYPQFYAKLYALLTPGVLHVKYRPRFLFWSDVFLTSTHISAQIVASFVKRLSRIALTASPDACLILLPMIGNLLVRHPSLSKMMCTTNAQTVASDPFDDSVDDPEATGAINSCLWEIKSLQKHFHPQVAKSALFINNELPNREWDFSELLETTYEDLIESALKTLSNEKELTFDGQHSQQLMDFFN